MTQMYRIICQLSLSLGLLSILGAVIIKMLHLEARLTTTSHISVGRIVPGRETFILT